MAWTPGGAPARAALLRALAAVGTVRRMHAGDPTWAWAPRGAVAGGWPRVLLRWGGSRDGLLRAAADAGVSEAWFVDPARGWTERYREPRSGRYRRRDLALPGEGLTPPGAARAVVPLPRAWPRDDHGAGAGENWR